MYLLAWSNFVFWKEERNTIGAIPNHSNNAEAFLFFENICE